MARKITSLGVALFFVFTLVAIALYPGGSQFHADSIGFSWRDNFWCELMVLETGYGKENPGGIFAIVATFFAGLAVSAFFYRLPLVCPTTALQSGIVRFGTIICSFSALMLFSEYHHEMLLAFCISGFITMLIALIVLIENREYVAFSGGTAMFALTQLNLAFYYLSYYKEIQPNLQKITIILALAWVLLVNLKLKAPTCAGQSQKHQNQNHSDSKAF